MKLYVPPPGRQPAGLFARTGANCLGLGFAILLWCTCVLGQSSIENYHSYAAQPYGAFGPQLITPNALRAPAKAQRAVDKAAAAIKHQQASEAEKQLARALELYPDYAMALMLRGIWKMNADRSNSIKDLERAIHVDPQYGVSYAVLASIYNDDERYDDAIPLIHRAMQLLPAAWPVHYEMARALCGNHQSLEALREVTEAERRMSADKGAHANSIAAVHYLRGILLVDQHELAEATREFGMSIDTQPQGPLAAISTRIVARLESGETR
jgi:tetratricopeptide (TPR) repeat protein